MEDCDFSLEAGLRLAGGNQSEFPSMTSEALKAQSRKNLASMARRRGVTRWHSMTKPELVRALLRLAAAKRSAATATASSRARRLRAAAARNGHKKNGKSALKNGDATSHVLPLRDRDLCTTEIDDRVITGRKNYIDAVVSDAHWIRVQWELTRDSIRRAETRLGTDWHTAVPALRLFEVATDDVNSVSELKSKDVLIDAGVNTWYVHVPPDARTYRLHIGYRTRSGMFFALAKSNVCSMPVLNANIATGKNGNLARNGHTPAEKKADPPGAKPDGRLGRPLGFSSLSHFGPAATEEREKGEFSFKLDTELIVHGSTRPGSNLTVQGDPVELREDGSFTIRVNQPEGRQVIAFTALSPRGSERRMIVLGIERNTKELERQYFDGGHPDGHFE
jgi:hypothetical protein